MAGKGSNSPSGPVKREVTITRIFDAPRELVFEMWVNPRHIAQWWGPHGFTAPVCQLDVRPGGSLLIVMRGMGMEHSMRGKFLEVIRPERLVFTSVAEDRDGTPLLEAHTVVTFSSEPGNQTKLTLCQSAVGRAAIATQMLEGMEIGWTQSLERLADLSGEVRRREIVITRLFDAPRALVWKAWTDPKHLVQWWGPNGFTTTIQKMELKPGGAFDLIMHGPDGVDYPNVSVFTEVRVPERIVYSLSGGKDGGPSADFESAWTFVEEGGKTRLTNRMVFESAEKRDRIAKTYGAVEGGNQTLGRLAEHLAKMP